MIYTYHNQQEIPAHVWEKLIDEGMTRYDVPPEARSFFEASLSIPGLIYFIGRDFGGEFTEVTTLGWMKNAIYPHWGAGNSYRVDHPVGLKTLEAAYEYCLEHNYLVSFEADEKEIEYVQEFIRERIETGKWVQAEELAYGNLRAAVDPEEGHLLQHGYIADDGYRTVISWNYPGNIQMPAFPKSAKLQQNGKIAEFNTLRSLMLYAAKAQLNFRDVSKDERSNPFQKSTMKVFGLKPSS